LIGRIQCHKAEHRIAIVNLGKSLVLTDELFGSHKLKSLKIMIKTASTYRSLGQMSQAEVLI
jgi:hypothetical protein